MRAIVPFMAAGILGTSMLGGCGGAGTKAPPKAAQRDSFPPLADSSWAMIPFVKVDSVNPVLEPGHGSFFDPLRGGPVKWDEKDVFNPAIVVRGDKVVMLYRGQDNVGKPAGTSRIGVAISHDGFHFVRRPQPVLYPAGDAQEKLEWEGGCEDPRVVQDAHGVYYMTYTAYDGRTARLMIATSLDLRYWEKHGCAFEDAYNGKYSRSWSKSGSIVSRYVDGKVVATKINGKYWMYWGDQDIWVATSDDLIHWMPMEMPPGEKPLVALKGQALNMPRLTIVVGTRNGYWDSDLVESGPPAMITKDGILLIYNGKNSRAIGDTTMAEGAYGGGQVLLDKHDPTRVLRRLDHNFIHPDRPYEITGQVDQVCFLEGLAHFDGHWLLYYGTADSKIAVAEGPDKQFGQ